MKKDNCNFLPEDVHDWEIIESIKEVYEKSLKYDSELDSGSICQLHSDLKKDFIYRLGARWLNEYIEHIRN